MNVQLVSILEMRVASIVQAPLAQMRPEQLLCHPLYELG